MSRPTPCLGDPARQDAPAAFRAPESVRAGSVKKSRMGRRRAWVLIAVHVAIFLHILHWKLAGKTLSPLEPSEAMYTLLHGTINAGAILLLGTLAATLVFGRFFCGWACHLVAVQDFCAWLLKKIGIRPRPLRSRWLMWVPLLAGLYMFLIGPLGGRLYAGAGMPEFKWGMQKTEFWETFPGPWISALTFVFAGGVMIYLLGAKGFCTYACPYGGLFGVVDRLAPGRIRVTDACKACGHCTAVCTSNVVVHREVHEYGMVVDPGCMKCMDCISVCPENALYFGFGKVASFAKPRRTPKARERQFTRAEELTLVLVFSVTLAVFAGLPAGIAPWGASLNSQTPLLFSLGLAATTAFVAAWAFRLLGHADMTFLGAMLRQNGRLTAKGKLTGALAALWLLFVADCGFVQYHVWQGDRQSAGLDLYTLAFDPEAVDRRSEGPIREALDDVERHFTVARRFGVLSGLDLRLPSRLAGLAMAKGDPQRAVTLYQDAAAIDDDFAPTQFELSQAMWMAQDFESAARHMIRAADLDPKNGAYHQALGHMAMQFVNGGAYREAVRILRRLATSEPTNEAIAMGLADALRADQDLAAAIASLGDHLARSPTSARARCYLGMFLIDAGDKAAGIAHLEAALPLAGDFPDAQRALDAAR